MDKRSKTEGTFATSIFLNKALIPVRLVTDLFSWVWF